MSVRDQGKACFAELQDSEGSIVYLNRDVLCPGDDKTMYNQVLKN
jgi:lysyl-tRNA synthetase class 2